ncbi:MAG: WD40 repeat domain-containing protein, partial [Anaerolineales bacterium]
PLKMIDIIGLDADCFNEMVFSPDGTIIACSTFKDTVALLDTAYGGILRILDPEQGQIDNIMFLPDGKTVASMGGGCAILWDIESGGRLHNYCPYGTIAWSPTGKVIASTGPLDSINLWDPASGELLRTIADPDHVFIAKDFNELLFLGDDDHLVGLSHYGPVIAWDLASGRVIRMMEDFSNWADFLGFSPDGRSLAITSYSGFFSWEVPQREKPPSAPNLLFRLENIKSGVLSPNGGFLTQISSEDKQKTITLLDLPTGTPVWSRIVQSRGLSTVFSPDGEILASVDFDGEIIFWRAADGGRIRMVGFPEGFINDVAFSNDGSRFAAASREGVVRVWDTASGKNIATFVDEGYRSSNLCLVFSPVGNDLFFLIRDFRIMKWDGIPGHSAVVDRELVKGPLFSARTLLSISPDGQWFAVVFRESGSIAGSKSVIRIFPLADRSTDQVTVGSHNSTISQIGFSPDGKTLASSSSDGTVVLWDIEDAISQE